MYICLNRGTTGGGLPLDQFVQLASTAGFHGADVDLGYAQTHGTSALADLYASHNCRFGGWGAPDWRGTEQAWKTGLEQLPAHAKIAAELKIDSCATWLMPSSELSLIDNFNFHVTRLKPLVSILADHGLRFGLEFVAPYHLRQKFKHEFLFTPRQMLELADAIGPNCGLLVDCFHVHCAGSPMDEVSKIPAGRIVLAHLNDAPKVPVHEVQDGTRVLPGEGSIDTVAYLKALKAAGYTGAVSLEVFSADLKALAPQDAAKKAWDATKKVWDAAQK